MEYKQPLIIRVTGRETLQQENPLPNIIENISNGLKQTGLFIYIGDSRITGHPMFKMDHNILLRKYKIHKIINNEHIDEIYIDYNTYVMETLKMYAGDIEIVAIIEEHIDVFKYNHGIKKNI